jgi:hypothetical protein
LVFFWFGLVCFGLLWFALFGLVWYLVFFLVFVSQRLCAHCEVFGDYYAINSDCWSLNLPPSSSLSMHSKGWPETLARTTQGTLIAFVWFYFSCLEFYFSFYAWLLSC